MNYQHVIQVLTTLAERGEPHERELAAKRLAELLNKYPNLDTVPAAEEVSTFDIRWYKDWEQRLIAQVAYKVLNDPTSYIPTGPSGRKLKVIQLRCTQSQYMEISYLYSFYHELFENEFDLFFNAFCQKHSLFGHRKDKGVETGLSPEELARLTMMISSLQDSSPNLALEDQSSKP